MNNNNLNLNKNNERKDNHFCNTEKNKDNKTDCLKTDKSSCHLSDNSKYTQEIWKNVSGFDDDIFLFISIIFDIFSYSNLSLIFLFFSFCQRL